MAKGWINLECATKADNFQNKIISPNNPIILFYSIYRVACNFLFPQNLKRKKTIQNSINQMSYATEYKSDI